MPILLKGSDLDEPARHFGDDIQLGRLALDRHQLQTRFGGGRARTPFVTKFHDPGQGKRRFRSIEPARIAAPEHVLQLERRHGGRALACLLYASIPGLQPEAETP